MAGSNVSIAIEVQGVAQADAAVKVVKRSLEDLGTSGTEAGRGVQVVKRSLDDLGSGSASTAPSLQNLSSCMTSLESCSSLLRSSLQALLTVKLKDFFMEAVGSTVMFAANVELANRALGVIGNATGHTVAEMTKYRDALKEINITTATATNVTTQFARSGLPLESMNKLAAGAQGAAIAYQMMTGETISSSQALDKMTRAIQTGMVVELHQLGIMVSQKQIQKENGGQLDEYTRKQELLKAVLKDLGPLTELYANSQDLAAKKISSAKRPIEELKLALGELFLPELSAAATGFYETVSGGMKWVKEHAATLNTLKQVIQDVCSGIQFAAVALGVYTLAVMAATAATTNFGIAAKLSAVWQMLQTEMTLTGAAMKTTTAVTGIMGETIVTSAERATIAMKSLNSACLVIAVALAAWEIGTLLTKFEWVRKAGVLMVYGVMGAWNEFVFMTQKFKVSWNPFGDEAEQQANLAKVEADRNKWLAEFKKNFAEQMKDQENPVTGSGAKPYQDNARILADGVKRAAAQKAEAALKDAEQAKELAEKQAKYDKQVQDTTYAVIKQYSENARKLQADQTKDSLAQLLYEKEMGLRTVKSYLDEKYALERAASAQEVREAQKLVSDKQKTLDAMKVNPAVDAVMFKQEELKLAQAQGALQLAQEKQGNLEGEYWREAGKAIAAARTELEGYETKLKEISMTEADKAQAKIGDTYRPALDKALTQQGGATNPAEQAAADKLVATIGELIVEESRHATQQQLFGQREAQITLLKAQGTVVEAQQQQEQLDADKAILSGKDLLTTAYLKQANAINAIKAAQDRANVVTDMTSSTAIMNEADPYKKKLLQMEAAYQKEIKDTKSHLEQLNKIRNDGGTAYLNDSKNIDKDIAASSAWLTAKDKENHDNVTQAKMTMTADYLNVAGQAFTALAETQDQSSRQGFETAKALNIGAAIMSTAAAIIGQLAGPDAWTPIAWARAAMAGVMGAVQVAKIASTTFKGGGSASSAGASGSWGGSNGASSSVGSGISAPTTSIRDSQSQADLTRIAGSMESASIALVKVADGLTKIATLFESGTGKYLGGALSSVSIDNSGGGVPLANSNGFWSSTSNGAAMGATIGSILGPLGTVVGGVIGSVIGSTMNAMFGSGNSWYTKNSGLSLGISGGALTNQAYLNEQKDGGWFSGNETRTGYVAANSQATAAINSYLGQITAQVSRSAAVMGTTADLGSATLTPSQIQTSGRSAADIQKDLEAWLTTAAGAFAGTIKNLDQYIFPGEDKFTGLIRLATSLQGVNIELATIGGTLIESTMKGADAAYNLASAFGGLDKLQSASATYQKAMFTDTEQAAMKAAGAGLQVTSAFAEMGVAVPATKEGFKSLVNGLDLTTDRGRALFAALLNVSDSFATVINQADTLAKTLRESTQDLTVREMNVTGNTTGGTLTKLAFDQEQERLDYAAKGLDLTRLLVVQQLEWNKAITDTTTAIMAQTTELSTYAETLRTKLSDALTGAISVADALLQMKSTDASLTPLQKLNAARDTYTSTLTTAKTGDATAMGAVGGVGQAYLDAAKNYFGTAGGSYQAIYDSVTGSDGLGGLLGVGNATVSELTLVRQALVDVKKAVDLGTNATDGVDNTTLTQLQAVIGTTATMSTYLEQYLQADAAAKAAATATANDAIVAANKTRDIGILQEQLKTTVTAADPLASQTQSFLTWAAHGDVSLKEAVAVLTPEVAEIARTVNWLASSGEDPNSWFVTNWRNTLVAYTNGLDTALAWQAQDNKATSLRSQITALGGTPSYAVGSPFIPFDQTANIHQGEMIIDRRSADVLRSYGVPTTGAADNREGVAEQKRTTAELQALVRLQSAANQAIIERLDASEDRLRTIENQGRLAA